MDLNLSDFTGPHEVFVNHCTSKKIIFNSKLFAQVMMLLEILIIFYTRGLIIGEFSYGGKVIRFARKVTLFEIFCEFFFKGNVS